MKRSRRYGMHQDIENKSQALAERTLGEPLPSTTDRVA